MDQKEPKQTAMPQENLAVSLVSGGSGLPNEDAQVAGENRDQSLPTGNKVDESLGPGYPSRFGLVLLAVGLCFAVFLVALVRRYGRYCR